MNPEEENHCEYVCSRGILKSCDIRSATPISSIRQLIHYDFSQTKPGDVIYVCGSAVPHFLAEVAGKIAVPYVLVTGDCDESVPNDIVPDNVLDLFLRSPTLIHWFSQNCVRTTHPKLSQIPIGLDYHTLSERDHEWGPRASPLQQEAILKKIRASSKPTVQRECRAYANFQFLMTTRFGYDRQNAIRELPAHVVHYEPHKIPRFDTWTQQSQFAFVISPHGNGLDCHRTWEALALGCIPIVKRSPLDPLFHLLPVLIVDEWSHVTPELLQNTLACYRDMSEHFNLDRLSLRYWMQQIRSKVPESLRVAQTPSPPCTAAAPSKRRVAICLSGQPRKFREGHRLLKQFIDANPQYQFDIFVHCWFSAADVGQTYAHSYTPFTPDELRIQPDTDQAILDLYAPVAAEFEPVRTFDTSVLENTLMDLHSREEQRNNRNNMLSNLFSKWKANELRKKQRPHVSYDLVIGTRFDYLNPFVVDLDNVDRTKFNAVHQGGRTIHINDNYVIAPPSLYDVYTSAFHNIQHCVNNPQLQQLCLLHDHYFDLSPETLLLANMFLVYGEAFREQFCYRNDMLNFLPQ